VERQKMTAAEVRAIGSILAVTHTVDLQATTLITELAEAGAQTILLKGASIARHLRGPHGRPRAYYDIDLLIEPGADRICARALRGAGYRRKARSIHESCWIHSTLPIVEPHHRLWGVDVARRRCWDELHAVSEIIPLSGSDVRVLEPPGLAFHIALHAAQHRAAHAQVAELERALDTWPLEVWSEAYALATRLEAVDIFTAGLSLAVRGEEIREAIGAPASSSVWIALRVGDGGTEGHRLVALLDALNAPRWRDRIAFTARVVTRMIVPAPELMRAAYPGRSLWRAYLLSRPLTVARRVPSLLRGVRAARGRRGPRPT
jgi:hypothetical protein